MENTTKVVNEPFGFIYITTNIINGMKYLGKRKLSRGWKNYLGSGVYFKHALKHYGKENFYRDIVCICHTSEELCQVEKELGEFLNIRKDPNWYNLIDGGLGKAGYKSSEETKRKISRSRIGKYYGKDNPNYGNHKLAGENNPFYGKHHDEKTRKLLSDLRTGKPSPNKGKPMSEEQKIKLSQSRKDKKAVIQFSKDGKFIAEYESLSAASKATGILTSSISACCRGRPKTTKGFVWKYKDESN